MASVLNISISGKDASQRLLKVLEDGQVVRIGRTAKQGWEIPWDKMISRDHADVCLVDGGLKVQCLPQAQNPVIYCGKPVREAVVTTNEWFQIGGTTFHISSRAERTEKKPAVSPQQIEFCQEENVEGSERAYSAADLRKVSFGNSDMQMELLEQLPEKISGSHSDDDLGAMLSQLLLEAIPNALAVAVAHFDETELPDDVSKIDQFPKPLSMRVQTRENFEGRFVPSRRMILKCLKTQSSVVHVFESAGGESQFTMNEGLGWAFCSPIKAESGKGWCLYVSGQGTPSGALIITEDDLLGDLRFTQLVAQFIGSIRQVRMLQEQKTQLSSFFSPKVIEGLTSGKSKESLSPSEREISVLFCDVRGFTTLSEQNSPEAVVELRELETLAFTSDDLQEGLAAFADKRVITIGHPADEFVGIGELGGTNDLPATGLRTAVGDVLPNRAVEQQRVLENEADLLAK